MPFTKCVPGMGTKPRFVRIERDDDIDCRLCGDSMPRLRKTKLGIDTCLACSKEVPKEANVGLHKQAYTYSHNSAVIAENQYGAHK